MRTILNIDDKLDRRDRIHALILVGLWAVCMCALVAQLALR